MGVVVSRFGLYVGLLGVLCAEPSAFDLQSGATKQELNTLKSSNRNLENILTTLQNQTDALSQHQDGLNNLFKGQAAKLHDFSTTLESHDQALKSLKATQEMQADMLKSQANLLETLKTQVESNKNALQQLDQKIAATNQLITQMNTDFASKLATIQKSIDDQAQANAQKLQELARIQEKIIQEKTTPPPSPYPTIPSSSSSNYPLPPNPARDRPHLLLPLQRVRSPSPAVLYQRLWQAQRDFSRGFETFPPQATRASGRTV
ncbi:hypothetical protein [Helicobacter mehlei]|uniref:hypothetical protein n=1 Tax=Helicobacter mehlei TaxID=2316080 RepID=UPI000EAE0D7A|nr:hypothetical protein [Helicobacter mehlei]